MSNTTTDQGSQERQSLLSKLLDAVKQCQIRFGGRTELATENDSRIICLCTQFENVLQHGIRKNTKGLQRLRQVTEVMKGLNIINGESEPVFWHLVKTVLNKHEYERYMLLKHVNTDIGKGRAWLRSALNEHSLERYIHMLLSDTNQISHYYEDWSFLMDQERNSMLPMMAAGLGSILFAINIDNPDLNSFKTFVHDPPVEASIIKKDTFEPLPVMVKSSLNGQRKKNKKKKWPTTQVVSFDDNEMCQSQLGSQELLSCNSAPATCLPSPVSTTESFAAFSQTHSPEVIEELAPLCDTPKETNIPVEDSSSISTFNPSHKELEASDQTLTNVYKIKVSNSVAIPVSSQSMPSDSADGRILLASSSTSSATSLNAAENCLPIHATLMPMNNNSVGELIPVSHHEDVSSSADSMSIPSFCEDVDNAAAALEIAQRVHSWSITSNTSQSSRKGSQAKSRTETLTMSADELREAVLVVLQKKEDVEEKNKSLRSLLDCEMEMNAGLRAELEETHKHNTEKIEKLDSKIERITRENELLKHQLRKYITAVQMLKYDSTKIGELNVIAGDIPPPIPEPKLYIDHQLEASEYEKKLVQVAEMHGELMEFNDRLHRTLLQREATIRRLREELVDLRGPLPDENQTSDDDMSITSDYDASSQTTPLRPLINVWIPSAFLTGSAPSCHHVYQVYVRIRDDEWNVYRRYAQFYALHKALKRKDAIINTFDFPPKKTIGKKNAKVVEQRRRRLQHYLRCVLNWLLQNNVELANSPDRETFVSLMPFFSDQSADSKTNESTSGNRLRLPARMNSAPAESRTTTQHYTGL